MIVVYMRGVKKLILTNINEQVYRLVNKNNKCTRIIRNQVSYIK
jgi:hypothetical protein